MRRLLASMLVLVGGLLVAPSADAYIYWQESDGASMYGTQVGRADLDAGNVNHALVPTFDGRAVGANGTNLYWGERINPPNSFYIGRSGIDGSGANHMFQFATCRVVAIRATTSDLFWEEDCGPPNTVIRSQSGAAISPGLGGCGFDVDGSHVYYSHGRYIGRANLDGSNDDPTWLDIGAGFSACGVAVSATHVYWTLYTTNPSVQLSNIGRAAIAGTPSSVDNAFIGGANFSYRPATIDVEGQFLYWTNQPNEAANPYSGIGSIGRANLDGTGVDQDFISNIYIPVGLAVDAAGPAAAPPCTVCDTPLPPRPPGFPVGVSSSHGAFLPGRASTPIRPREVSLLARKPPVGTTFSFDLDKDASVTIEIRRKKGGRLVKGKCVKPSRKNKKAKRCDLRIATLFRNGVSGPNEVPFTGRIKGKALKPGKYAAVFSATASGGTSEPVPVPFRILSAK